MTAGLAHARLVPAMARHGEGIALSLLEALVAVHLLNVENTRQGSFIELFSDPKRRHAE